MNFSPSTVRLLTAESCATYSPLMRWVAIACGIATFAAPAFGLCPADCNGNGVVAIHELTRAVAVSMDRLPYRVCPPADDDGNGGVEVSDLVLAVASGLRGCPATVTLRRAPELSAPAGPQSPTRGVLPNGRYVEPAGRQVALATFPLNLTLTPDGRRLLVTNDGWGNEEGERGLQVVDVATRTCDAVEVPHFFGLAVDRRRRVPAPTATPTASSTCSFEGDSLVRDKAPLATFPDGTYPTGLTISAGRGSSLRRRPHRQLLPLDRPRGRRDAPARRSHSATFRTRSSSRRRAARVRLVVGTQQRQSRQRASSLRYRRRSERRDQLVDRGCRSRRSRSAPRLDRYIPIARSLKVDDRTIFGGSHPSAMALSPDGKLALRDRHERRSARRARCGSRWTPSPKSSSTSSRAAAPGSAAGPLPERPRRQRRRPTPLRRRRRHQRRAGHRRRCRCAHLHAGRIHPDRLVPERARR